MKKVKLLNVARIKNQSVDEFEGEKRYVATGGVDENKITFYKNVTYKNKPSRANIQVDLNRVIFARMKETNKVLRIIEKNKDYIYSTGFCVLEVGDKLLPEYLEIFLKSPYFQRQKDKLSTGATQKAINNTRLKKINIPLMQFQTQKKIVDVLDKAQELIDLRNKQIELLDELIQSIFYDMFGDPVTNPRGWEKIQIKKIGKLKSGGTPSRKNSEFFNGSIPWVTTTALGKRYVYSNNANEYITEEAVSKSSTKKIPKNSILIGVRVGVGKVSINNCDICTNQDIMSLTNITSKLNIDFLQYQIFTYNKYLCSHKRGATIKGITSKVIKDLNIIVPPIKLQNQFAEKVQKIEAQKGLMQESLTEMQNNFNSLMQKAFKGELFN